MKKVSILEAMSDRTIFGSFFRRGLLRGDTWKAWRAFLAALFGLPLEGEAFETYQRHTGRSIAPREPFREAFVVAGRRSGKSLISALVATFLAAFKSYEDVLAPGEVGTLMVIAADRRQARVIFNYICAFFEAPMLRSLVASKLKESLVLKNRVTIEIHTCSFRATRGYTLIGVIADELAFWNVEGSANPDSEVLAALRPGLATTGGLLLGISSPYAKRGALYEAFREHFGKENSDVLVWKAASREMNPTLSRAVVAAAYLRDSAAARAEYGGEFREDVSAFISPELLESVTIPNRTELPPLSNLSYAAFCDPSGGRSDAMTLAIAHSEREKAVLDVLAVVEPPFSPEQAVSDFVALLKRFRISEVEGDRYAGEWPREQFAKRGVSYRVADKTRSEIYLEFLPLLSSSRVELLDDRRLISQATSLERRTGHGRDLIDHPPGGHDDVINAAAGALVRAATSAGVYGYLDWVASGGRERLLLAQQQRPAPRTNPREPQPQTEVGQSCCGNPLRQTIPGGFRCANCGRQTHEAALDLRSPNDGECPACGSHLVVPLAGRFHCNSCSSDFGPLRVEPQYVSFANRFGPSRNDPADKFPWRRPGSRFR